MKKGKLPETIRRGRYLVFCSLILINMVSIMELSDENLLPAVYKEVSEAFNTGPADLRYLTFIRNFVQALSSPLAGVLVLHYDRSAVLAMGTACWALSTAAVGVSQQFLQVAFWRALNGLGLAIVISALQSFIADSYTDDMRGASLGFIESGWFSREVQGVMFWQRLWLGKFMEACQDGGLLSS